MALVAASGGAFLGLLDATIVNVSFPDISASFPDADRSELSWVLDGYFIVVAALMVPAGALADRFGRRRLFLLGVVGFVLSSLLCAIAPSWESLVAFRVVQGASSAILIPSSLALVLTEFPSGQRARAVAAWGASAALAAAAGPPLGGALVELADWRWIFVVNLPLGAIVLWLGVRGLRESRDEQAPARPDLVGAALAALSLGLLALALVEGGSWGWQSGRVLGALGGALVLGAVLVRHCARHPHPVVDPALMRIPSFRLGSVGMLLFSAAMFAVILGNVLFLTGIWHYTVLEAGLAAVPGALASTIVARPAGAVAERYGHRVVIVPGVVLYAVGVIGLTGAPEAPDFVGAWVPWSFTSGIGIGLAFPILGAAAVEHVEQARFGAACALSSTFRQVGAVIGTAGVVAIVGDPTSIADGMARADRAYLVAAVVSLVAGVVAAGLRPTGRSGLVEDEAISMANPDHRHLPLVREPVARVVEIRGPARFLV
ncbi:putative conserved two-domain membrane protein [Patulibacter medicamentivorans]|uniref:Putative conserved two-domain membrane protein n=2 Tax=Patulibacter medicamentivorans TaxID=1097667 RepID=H0E805_9ACTN|nr:putative conserved two-domain membrane protein [Patulibacter medicamentivorans]